MGSLLSSFQRIVGVKEFLHKVLMRHNLEVSGDVTVKGNLNVRGKYSSDRVGRTVPVSDSTTIDLGTYKRIDRQSVSGTFTTSGTINVDLSAIVPDGTKGVEVFISATDATVGTACRVRETGTAITRWAAVEMVANQNFGANGIIMLDGAYTFDISNSAEWDVLDLYVNGILL
jgi:hypothetical protein